MTLARTLFPAIRWSDETGFEHEIEGALRALELGVGGFILFGGPADEVAGLTARLRQAASHPLLFGSDLERGAGQQFRGATRLPPAGALGGLDDVETTWRAARTTAQEARTLGVSWIFAPVADRANVRDNPIVATRAFGSDAQSVARHVTAWVMGCLDGGGLPCLKHFPGHGRTATDSHAELPIVDVGFDELATDLVPFAAGVRAGAPSVMTAHVAYPILDPTGVPATRSAPILEELLRGSLQFDGVVVSDAMIMEGARAGLGEVEATLAAIRAGVDVILYCSDVAGIVAGLEREVERDGAWAARMDQCGRRLGALRARAAAVGKITAAGYDPASTALWADSVARRCVRWPKTGRLSGPARLLVVDDDLGGPYPSPSRAPLIEGLRQSGCTLSSGAGGPDTPIWLAVFADPRAWKGRAGLSEWAREQVARHRHQADLILLFGDPRIADDLPAEVPVVIGWGGEALMQNAVASAAAERLGEEGKG